MDPQLHDLDVAYARFNALKTLGSAEPSRFEVHRVGGLTVTRDPARRFDRYYHRVLGVGPHTEPEALDRALAVIAERDLPLRVDLEPVACVPRVCGALLDRGLRPAQALVVLDRPATRPARPLPTHIQRWGPDRAQDFLDLLGPFEPEVCAARRTHHCTDTFRVFVAHVEGVASAWATTFVQGGLGWLGNAFTLPAARGRGLHSALLLARIHDAVDLGLEHLVTDTGADTPSYRNARRAGFTVHTIPTVWLSDQPSSGV